MAGYILPTMCISDEGTRHLPVDDERLSDLGNISEGIGDARNVIKRRFEK